MLQRLGSERRVRIAAALVSAGSVTAFGADQTATGANGANGANGTNGNPAGTAGQAGGAGSGAYWNLQTADPTNPAYAYGGNGGSGGNGGNGAPGGAGRRRHRQPLRGPLGMAWPRLTSHRVGRLTRPTLRAAPAVEGVTGASAAAKGARRDGNESRYPRSRRHHNVYAGGRQIPGAARRGTAPGGQIEAFLLTPVPEPTALGLLSVAGLGLLLIGPLTRAILR